ncbi:helix-turn-helix domain-containing protein [Actinomadura geliboluensis]|uniref:helix-turn-helix domain-containing protein n=1 Tax=Actinomadura geliboluensis TaxID=882440 RepID=UPI0037152A7C
MEQLTPTQVVSRQVRELRTRRGMSAQALADRCAELGMPDLKRQAITNLENGRRATVTVDELLVLAYALDVPPVMLFVPLDGETRLQITPDHDVPSLDALIWVTGEQGPKDPHRKARWRQTIGPLSQHRDVWRLIEWVDRNKRRGDQEAFDENLRTLGRALDLMIENGITPPELPADWAETIRARGWTEYPDEVR